MKFLIVFVLFALLKQAGAVCYAGTDAPMCDNCGGSCVSSIGCLCSIDYTLASCIPTSCELDPYDCCAAVAGYSWDPSLSCCSDVPLCPACVSDEECVSRSGTKVCECNATTYIKKTIADFKPIVECESGTMSIYVSKCLLTHLGYDYTRVHLRNDSIECNYPYDTVFNSLNVIAYQLRTEDGWCGNSATIIDSQVYYTNTLHINTSHSTLITKNPIAFNFSCGYNLTMQTSLVYALHPAISTTVLVPVTGGGSFSATMSVYKDSEFVTSWPQEENVVVGTDIYLGIFTPDADATNFTLRVEKCIATPNNDSNDVVSVLLVNEGIAVNGEVDTQVLDNRNSLEARIRIKAFQFQNFPNLFIFCNVRLCSKTEACGQSGRSLNGNSAQLGLGFTLEDNTFYNNSGSHTAFSYVVMAASLLAFLCMSFF